MKDSFNTLDSLIPQDRLANNLQKEQNNLLEEIVEGTKNTAKSAKWSAIFSLICAAVSAIATIVTAVCAVLALRV